MNKSQISCLAVVLKRCWSYCLFMLKPHQLLLLVERMDIIIWVALNDPITMNMVQLVALVKKQIIVSCWFRIRSVVKVIIVLCVVGIVWRCSLFYFEIEKDVCEEQLNNKLELGGSSQILNVCNEYWLAIFDIGMNVIVMEKNCFTVIFMWSCRLNSNWDLLPLSPILPETIYQ